MVSLLICGGLPYSLGYFTLDNAANNDTCIDFLADEYDFDAAERRIRCAPHTINLAVRSMIYGDGAKKVAFDELLGHFQQQQYGNTSEEIASLRDAIRLLEEDELWDEHEDEVLASMDEDEVANLDAISNFPPVAAEVPALINANTIEKYRKSGPFGKLHNIGVSLRLSSQLNTIWMECQRAIDPSQPALAWRHNVATRWLSDEAMAARALNRRPALDRLMTTVGDNFSQRPKKSRCDRPPDILQHKLTEDEWLVVSILQRVLEQFKISSKILQGDGFSGLGQRSTTGSFSEYFPQIESLMDHLECAVRGFIVEEQLDGTMTKVLLFEGVYHFLNHPSKPFDPDSFARD